MNEEHTYIVLNSGREVLSEAALILYQRLGGCINDLYKSNICVRSNPILLQVYKDLGHDALVSFPDHMPGFYKVPTRLLYYYYIDNSKGYEILDFNTAMYLRAKLIELADMKSDANISREHLFDKINDIIDTEFNINKTVMQYEEISLEDYIQSE